MDSLVNTSYKNIATRPIKFYEWLQKPRALYINHTSLRKQGMDGNSQTLPTSALNTSA